MEADLEKLQRDNYKLKKENSDMRDFVAKKVTSLLLSPMALNYELISIRKILI
jgi:cell division septum initiation protein DivIVA